MVLYLSKKVSAIYVSEDIRCYKIVPIFYKNKVHFVDTLSRQTNFGIPQSHGDQKIATMSYN